MNRRSYTQYVHKWETDNGATRFAVGEWMAKRGQYLRVFDATERRTTGCFAEFGKLPSALQSYKSRRVALRRARWLYYEQDRKWIDQEGDND